MGGTPAPAQQHLHLHLHDSTCTCTCVAAAALSAVYRHPRPYYYRPSYAADCPLTACCASPTESNRPPATCHHLCAFLDMRRLPALISLHLPTLISMHFRRW